MEPAVKFIRAKLMEARAQSEARQDLDSKLTPIRYEDIRHTQGEDHTRQQISLPYKQHSSQHQRPSFSAIQLEPVLISLPGYLDERSWSCFARYCKPSSEQTFNSFSYTMSSCRTWIWVSFCCLCGGDPKNMDDLLLSSYLFVNGVSRKSWSWSYCFLQVLNSNWSWILQYSFQALMRQPKQNNVPTHANLWSKF